MPARGIVTIAQDQGLREYQEDFIVHVPFKNHQGYGHLIGIFDGHGGHLAADLCAKLLPLKFDPTASDPECELAQLVQTLHYRTQFCDEGSTLSLAYINESKQYAVTAVLGDSPIIVIDRDTKVHFSEAHNVRTNVRERERTILRGAVYSEGYIHNAPGNDYGYPSNEGLQLSRALGDRIFGRILDREPVITRHSLGPRSAVLVASDGLLDPAHDSRERDDLIELMTQRPSAKEILNWKMDNDELDDNASLILWRPRRWWELF